MASKALTGNASDPEQVKDAQRKAERIRNQQLNDIKKVMSSVEGRRLIWRQLSAARFFEVRFSENSLRMAFNEGNANQAAWLMADIDAACPELFDQMRREAKINEDSNE